MTYLTNYDTVIFGDCCQNTAVYNGTSAVNACNANFAPLGNNGLCSLNYALMDAFFLGRNCTLLKTLNTTVLQNI